MIKIPMFSKEIIDCNIINVFAGTTCPGGGDSGHGGRTVFGIKDCASTDLRVQINDEPIKEVSEIKIILGGDAEYDTFIKALEFALETLKNKYKENSEQQKSKDFFVE